MEAAMEISQELGKLWGHRQEADFQDSCLSDAIDQPLLEVAECEEVVEHIEPQAKDESLKRAVQVDGTEIGDFPARYTVEDLGKDEFPAIGLYIDPRIVPGFKYRVRALNSGGRERWFWNGDALELESIGRGYSRRLTFSPPPGSRNENPHYFWADSWDYGFAFQAQLVSAHDQFTVFDASNLPVASLSIVQIQGGQVEVGQRVLDDGSIEKVAKIKALAEVEWYSQDHALPTNTLPLSGRAISTKRRSGGVTTKVVNASLGGRTYTLRPGTSLLTTHVHGASISDVPTTYTIIGLEPHQLPVIGTYIDPRIAVGFHYRVARVGGVKKWVWREPVRLDSVGKGYGKRLAFSASEANTKLDKSELYLWSDSHPDGLGFEHAAVRPGATFAIYAGELRLGKAHVFRTDAPQTEKSQSFTEEGLVKEVHVEVTCTVELESTETTMSTTDIMKVSGTAVLLKRKAEQSARILRLEDIGLESQLNLLFLRRSEELLFLPL